MENVGEERQPLIVTLGYWALLLAMLLLVDDLVFSWIFWLLAQLVNPWFSALVAFIAYWAGGYALTLRGLSSSPGWLASWLLKKFQLESKNSEMRERQRYLKHKIKSVAAAIPMSLLFGGVVMTLWLRRNHIISTRRAKSLGFWLCGIYAVEFAAVHGLGIGGLIYWLRQ